MTRSHRIATFLAASWLLAAGVATAEVPDPSNCTCPPCIRVVGHNGVVGDPAGQFCVIVRDVANNPIPNALVVIDFSGCDIQLCDDQKDPAVVVDCVAQTVRKVTDASGSACFRIIGKARGGLGCTGASGPCARVFADGVFLCTLTTAAFDLINDAAGGGITGNDVSEWLRIFFNCGYLTRGDYDCSGTLSANDFSVLLGVFFAAQSSSNCPPPTKCP